VSLEEGVALVLQDIEYWRSAPVWTPESIASATHDWFKYLGTGEEPTSNHLAHQQKQT
jgi:UDP-glucose 4-epimerase